MDPSLQRFTSDHVTWTFEPRVDAAYSVVRGETFVVEMMDALAGQVRHGMTSRPHVERANPATGPIAVRGIVPGQVVAVDILSLDVAPEGYLTSGDGPPVFFEQAGGVVEYAPGAFLPMAPMIGTIGVAPATGCFTNSEAGDYGGNMDTRDVAAGATLYLTAQVPGGMLALGDVHSLQADGESSGQGIETACEATLRVRVLDQGLTHRPYLVKDGHLMLIATEKTLDEAASAAVEDMARLVVTHSGLSYRQARQLLGLVGDIRIGQIVNPQETVRMALPLTVVPWSAPLVL